MDIQNLLGRSFAIWRRVRSLWVVGVIAALFGYGEYGANVSYQWRNTTSVPFAPGGSSPIDQLRAADPQLDWLLGNLALVIAAVVVLGLLWALVAGVVGALTSGAMISLADSAERGLPTDLGGGMRAGAARTLPIFLINLILALPGLLILAILFAAVGSFLWRAFSGGVEDPETFLPAFFGIFCCTLLLMIPGFILAVFLSLIGRLAARACVIEGLGALDSLRRSWGLIRRSLGPTLLLWLLMGLAGLVLSALMGLPALAMIIPIGLSIAQEGFSGFPVLAAVGLAIYGLVVNVGVGGVLTSLNATIWTLFYRGLLEREGGGDVLARL